MRFATNLGLCLLLLGPTGRADPPAPPGRAAAEWSTRWDDAAARSATQGLPGLLFAVLPGDDFTRDMDGKVWSHPEVAPLLPRFALARIDVETQAQTVARMEISAVPTLILFSPDGRELQRLVGVSRPEEVAAAMRAALGGREGKGQSPLFDSLASGIVSTNAWPELLGGLGATPRRAEHIRQILALKPFPADRLADALAHPRLAVRMGAIDVLEQAAGEDFGFDPWIAPPAAADESQPAVARWRAWAAGAPAGLDAAPALTPEKIARLIADRLGADSEASRRAGVALAQGGPAAARAIEQHLAANPGLGPGQAGLLRETRYLILLPPGPRGDASAVAKALVAGAPDVQARAVRELGAMGEAALPVVRDFLPHPGPMVREAAVASLLKIGGRTVVAELKRHVEGETDREVIVTLARELGRVRTKSALALLTRLLEHDDEDVVITALGSVARLESKTAAAEIAALTADGRWRIRAAAVACAAALKIQLEPDRVDALTADPDSFVRHQAIQALPVLMANKKEAAVRMEKLFLDGDETKVVVLASMLGSDLPIPPSFLAAIQSSGPDLLLPLLSALRDSGEEGAALVLPFAEHTNADVSISALKILAKVVAKNGAARAALLRALQADDLHKVRAVLDSLEGYHLREDSGYGPVSAGVTDLFGSGGEPTGPLQELISAFGLGPPPGRAGLDDLAGAFGLDTPAPVAAVRAAPAAKASLKELIDALAVLSRADDVQVAVQASLVLLGAGRDQGFDTLRKHLGELSARQTAEFASLLARSRSKEAADVLGGLVKSADAAVREAAAVSLTAHLRDERSLPALIDALLVDGPGAIKPASVLRQLKQGLQALPSSRKAAARTQLARLWGADVRPALVVTALFCAPALWEAAWKEPVLALAGSDNPYIRRAAFHCLIQVDTAGHQALRQDAADDPHPLVRATALYQLESSSTDRIEFGPGESEDTYEYSSRSSRLRKNLSGMIATLAADSDPELRLRALLLQMEMEDPVDAAAIMGAIRESANPEAAESAAANALESSLSHLDARHAALLPLVQNRSFSESRREEATRRLTPAAGSAQALAGVAPGEAPDPDAPVLQVIFFHAPGCDDCAKAREALAPVKEQHPGWSMVEHDIHSEAGAELNRRLCLHFKMEGSRGKAPAVFMSGGGLVGADITIEKALPLADTSAGEPMPDVSQAGELKP